MNDKEDGINTRDDLNRVVWKCSNCFSIIKSKEEDKLEVCSVCKKRSLEKIGINYSFERKEACMKILKDPSIFQKITEEEFDKKIVGEVESRKVIFLCGAGGINRVLEA